jgi:hypothetical protein
MAFLARSAGVGGTFLVVRLAANAIARLLDAQVAPPEVLGEAIGAIVAGATLAWLAGRLEGSRLQRGLALWTMAFASVAAVMIEGSAFAPALSPAERLPVALLLQVVVCAAVAGVAAVTSPDFDDRATAAHPAPRGIDAAEPRAFAVGIAAGALTYVIAYLVTGGLVYLLVTGPYYERHAGGLETPAPSIVLVVAALEGLLMAAAAVPVAKALPGPTSRRGLVAGLALWALGGLVPLLQVSALPDVIRVASAVEILLQKVPVGIVIARRFRR